MRRQPRRARGWGCGHTPSCPIVLAPASCGSASKVLALLELCILVSGQLVPQVKVGLERPCHLVTKKSEGVTADGTQDQARPSSGLAVRGVAEWKAEGKWPVASEGSGKALFSDF